MRRPSSRWCWLAAPAGALACWLVACTGNGRPAPPPRTLPSSAPVGTAAGAAAQPNVEASAQPKLEAPTHSTNAAVGLAAATPAVRAVAAGPYRTCAVLADGTARCWGAAWARFTASGSYPRVDRPQPMAGLTGVVQIALGEEHACARLIEGAVRCWGRNREGELGDGSTRDSETPTMVQGLTAVTDIATGAHHTCAIAAGGNVWCWGRNHVRQLGEDGVHPIPVPVAGVTDARQLALGANHSCALGTDGSVRCWGVLGAPLGLPAPVVREPPCVQPAGPGVRPKACPHAPAPVSPPVRVSGAQGAAEIGAGGFLSCARMRDGRVLCWGSNAAAGLGDGTQVERIGVVTVPGVCPATSLAVGEEAACVVCADRSVSCWGDNPCSGHTVLPGDGPMVVLRPTAVPGLTGVAQVARAAHHACALAIDGAVRCWGQNAFGEVGNGTNRFERDAVAVAW